MQKKQVFEVVKPGILTTFQDLGREGYQKFGVPVSGAMDRFALQIANMLVGNQRGMTCLEVTLIGPVLKVTTSEPIVIAITGAALSPERNGEPVPMWESIRLYPGDELRFGNQKSGVRAYIALAGGFETTLFFGSSSTDVNSGFGQPLQKKQLIYGCPAKANAGVGLKRKEIPVYSNVAHVAVVTGPHEELFPNELVEEFFNTEFIVDTDSNRMGYRLKQHSAIAHNQEDIWSDAVPFGGIQVPQNGAPIILMADRQTTGGYPRIGTVISTDLPKVAQLIPKGKIRFNPISIEKAQEKTVQMEEYLCTLEKFIQGINR